MRVKIFSALVLSFFISVACNNCYEAGNLKARVSDQPRVESGSHSSTKQESNLWESPIAHLVLGPG